MRTVANLIVPHEFKDDEGAVCDIMAQNCFHSALLIQFRKVNLE